MNLARIIEFRHVGDECAGLNAAQFGDGMPFVAKRFFTIWSGQREVTRGGHANYRQSELIVCVRGSVTVSVEDRGGSRAFILSSSCGGLYLPAMTWTTMVMKPRSEVLVLASDLHDDADYLRNREEFEEAHATA